MNISHEKHLTDLHYGNTNKHSICRFEELFAHPNYKKHIQPELSKFLFKNFNNEIILNEENSINIMNKINSFSFLSVHELLFNKTNVFFDMADCISLKEDIFDLMKEWQIEDLSKNPYSREKRSYAINHPTLTSEIGLFKYNKKNKTVESLIKRSKILTEESCEYVSTPLLKIPNVSQELREHIAIKYKGKLQKISR